MKKRIISIVLSALMLTTAGSTYTFAETYEENIEAPQFYFTDEDGNVTEIVDFEYVDTYYVTSDEMNAMRTASFDPPIDEENFYDLADGQYLYRNESPASTYELDKWVHASSEGKLYFTAYVGDAEGELHLCEYRNTGEVWHIREYVLKLHEFNSRARCFKGHVSSIDRTGEKYYSTAVVADSGTFGFGVLKISWEDIDEFYDYDSFD